MALSDDLKWRGFLEQTTLKDIRRIDSGQLCFYWGVDPSADSMTIGNLAIAMLVRHFILAGHRAVLLVGGATGLIGDPDGKSTERTLKSSAVIKSNVKAITAQYRNIFRGLKFEVVNNYDWFKGLDYLDFLRETGKEVPMSQLLGREFVQSRLGTEGGGISYAEFSYVLIQAYDFLSLYKKKGVKLQVAGNDQWANCLAGIDLIRRQLKGSADVWTAPLIVDKSSGQKFGKTEAGAIWLDSHKTTPTAFYQFWMNVSDESVGDYLKIYTMLSKEKLEDLLKDHLKKPQARLAQKTLAAEVTTLVHGQAASQLAASVSDYLIHQKAIAGANKKQLEAIKKEIPSLKLKGDFYLVNILVATKLAKSNNEAKSLLANRAIYVNGQPFTSQELSRDHFSNGRMLIRRGKAFKDSALLEL